MRHRPTNTENKRMRGHIFHASLTGEEERLESPDGLCGTERTHILAP